MIYGYCRISTPRQNIERQVRNITDQYPDAIIYRERYTGTKLDRPEWRKLYRRLQPGDTIVFDSVSRMSRSADDGIALYKELYKFGVELVFLKEPLISTAVYKETARRAVPMTGTDVDIILRGESVFAVAYRKADRISFCAITERGGRLTPAYSRGH